MYELPERKGCYDDDDDDDISSELIFAAASKKKGKIEKKAKITKKVEVIPEDPKQVVTESSKKRVFDEVIIIEDIIPTSKNLKTDISTSPPLVEDSLMSNAKILLEKVKNKKAYENIIDCEVLTDADVSYISRASKVKTAEERNKEKDYVVEQLLSTYLVSQSQPQETATIASSADLDEEKGGFSLTTRLNSKHIWHLKADTTMQIMQIKKAVRRLYNIADGEKIIIQFEGQSLRDEDRIEDAELENEDLLDIKIRPEIFDACVGHAGKSGGNGSIKSLTAVNSAIRDEVSTAAKPVESKPADLGAAITVTMNLKILPQKTAKKVSLKVFQRASVQEMIENAVVKIGHPMPRHSQITMTIKKQRVGDISNTFEKLGLDNGSIFDVIIGV